MWLRANLKIKMVLWVLKYSPNFDQYISCPHCDMFFAFLRRIFNRTVVSGIERLFCDLLYVANVHRIQGGNFVCICGTEVGTAEGSSIRFDRYHLHFPFSSEDEDGLSNELDVRLQPGEDAELIWGCMSCRRPIGYGLRFLSRIVRTLDLMNSSYMQNVPLDDVYYLEDGLRVVCRCGEYIGYMDNFDRVVLGVFTSLNDMYYG